MTQIKSDHWHLVHDAGLELKSDPEKYSPWQHQFIGDLEQRSNKSVHTQTNFSLSEKQRTYVEQILADN